MINRQILLLEDDAEVAAWYISLLHEQLGYAVDWTNSASKAMNITAGHADYSFAILDLELVGSEITGADVGIHLRRNWPLLPTVALSGYADSLDYIPSISRAGFDEVCSKKWGGKKGSMIPTLLKEKLASAENHARERIKREFCITASQCEAIEERLDALEKACKDPVYSRKWSDWRTAKRLTEVASIFLAFSDLGQLSEEYWNHLKAWRSSKKMPADWKKAGVKFTRPQAWAQHFQTRENELPDGRLGRILQPGLVVWLLALRNPGRWRAAFETYKSAKQVMEEFGLEDWVKGRAAPPKWAIEWHLESQ